MHDIRLPSIGVSCDRQTNVTENATERLGVHLCWICIFKSEVKFIFLVIFFVVYFKMLHATHNVFCVVVGQLPNDGLENIRNVLEIWGFHGGEYEVFWDIKPSSYLRGSTLRLRYRT
jgi:hypothetical protein